MHSKTQPQRHPNTALEVVVGSTVHGTNVEDGLEDLDLMAIVVETAREFVGFADRDTWTWRTKPEGVRSEAGDIDLAIYGLRRYLTLALNGNPTMLLALFARAPHVRHVNETGRQLQALAPLIVSKNVFMPFRGYMRQQHERLLGLRGQRNVTRPELVKAYGFDTKYASHVVRLGLQGEELLLTGKLTLPMREPDRLLVRDVRNGKFTLTQVSTLVDEAEKRLVRAYELSPLPDQPNRAVVEEWMVNSYLVQWAWAC